MDLGSLDLRRAAIGVAGRVARAAPEGLIDRVAELVRQTPPERLDSVMRSPIRRVVLDAIFWQMPQHLDRRRASGVNAAIRWRITGRADGEADVYDLIIADGRASVRRGGHEIEPRLTITVDAAEFIRVAAGSSNPISAYFNGKLALRGDLMQATRLTMLFRIPSPDTGQPGGRPPSG
jgi:putative sterol carrier protein